MNCAQLRLYDRQHYPAADGNPAQSTHSRTDAEVSPARQFHTDGGGHHRQHCGRTVQCRTSGHSSRYKRTHKHTVHFITGLIRFSALALSAFTLLVGRQEEDPAWVMGCWPVWSSVWGETSWCHYHPKPRPLLPHLNPDWIYFSGTGLPRLSWKRGR